MRYFSTTYTSIALLLGSSLAAAQPPGITMEMITRSLPLEGAPLAIAGPYEVLSEGASAGHILFRPANLAAFPSQDTLPLMVWGNGGCSINGTTYSEFLSTIASHGFLVMTTTAIEGAAQRQQGADDMLAAIAWAEAENKRSGSPLAGKIDTASVAVMGQSCGGFLSIGMGADPRVGTIGVFNSGVTPANPEAPPSPFPTTEGLAKLHGPVLFINGGEVDFMYGPSRANYEQVTLPAFYGARDNAGHTATVYHPGGGEFANVASNWLKYQFKSDAVAGKMFVGSNCELCTNPNWETASKDLK